MAHWIENDAEWSEQRLVHCGCCGRLIAKHFLVEEMHGANRIFCSEACLQLYRDYLLPERGAGFRPASDATAQYETLMAK